jgi:hypothetical protein
MFATFVTLHNSCVVSAASQIAVLGMLPNAYLGLGTGIGHKGRGEG